MRIRSLVLSAALLALPFPLMADTIYTYTGNTFDEFEPASPYTSSDFVSGSFTLASPLAANLSLRVVTPISYSFSDGLQSANDGDSVPSDFFVSTDASGDITWWNLVLELSDTGVISTDALPEYDGYIYEGETAQDLSFPPVTILGESLGSNQGAYNTEAPGTWAVSTTTDPVATPEPGSLFLAVTGLLGVAGLIRRRLRHAGTNVAQPFGPAIQRCFKSAPGVAFLGIVVFAGLVPSASATTVVECQNLIGQAAISGPTSVNCGSDTETRGGNTATSSAQAEAQYGVLREEGSAQTTGVLQSGFLTEATFTDYLTIDSTTAFTGTLSFTYQLDGSVSELDPSAGGLVGPELNLGLGAGPHTEYYPTLGLTNTSITISDSITSSEFSSTGDGYQTGPIELFAYLVTEGSCGENGDSAVPACSLDVDFLDTAEVTGFTIEDSSGNPVGGAALVSSSGTNYGAIPQDTAATPEPSSLLLLGSGILGGAGVIRRRRVLPS